MDLTGLKEPALLILAIISVLLQRTLIIERRKLATLTAENERKLVTLKGNIDDKDAMTKLATSLVSYSQSSNEVVVENTKALNRLSVSIDDQINKLTQNAAQDVKTKELLVQLQIDINAHAHSVSSDIAVLSHGFGEMVMVQANKAIETIISEFRLALNGVTEKLNRLSEDSTTIKKRLEELP